MSKHKINDKVTVDFRDAVDSFPSNLPPFNLSKLSPEELKLRRDRFERIAELVKAFNSGFDSSPYSYSELIAEAVAVLTKEAERIKAE